MDVLKLRGAPTGDLIQIWHRNSKGVGTSTQADMVNVKKILYGRATDDPKLSQWVDANLASPEPAAPEPKSVGGFISNIGSDTAEQAGNIAQAVLSPIDTFESLKDVAKGGMMHAVGFEPSQESENRRSYDMAGQFGNAMSDRYGSWEGFKNQAYEHPVETVWDMSGLATGGGGLLSKVPKVGKYGTALQKTGRAIDPVNRVAQLPSNVKSLRGAITDRVAARAGMGGETLKQHFDIGAETKGVGEVAEILEGHLRGTRPQAEAIEFAKQGVQELQRQRSVAYKAGLERLGRSDDPLKIEPVKQAVADAVDEYQVLGEWKSDDSSVVAQKIYAQIDAHLEKAAAKPELLTATGFDLLKQQLRNNIKLDVTTDAVEIALRESAVDAIKGQIGLQNSFYEKMMTDYAQASDELWQIKKTLSLTPTATVDTQMRKLLSIMRNNANTNFGQRLALGTRVDEGSGGKMMAAIAGQTAHPPAPTGLARYNTGSVLLGTGAGAMSGSPAVGLAVAGADAVSRTPRVLGEAYYGAGKAYGNVMPMVEKAKGATGKLSDLAKAGASKAGTTPKTLAEIARQSGRAQRLSDDEYSNTKITSLRR